MPATGVTFKKVTVVWEPYSETIPSSALSAFITKDISIASKGTKLEQPVPPAAGTTAEADKPIFYPMGRQGEVVKLVGYLKTEANYDLWAPPNIVQGTLLYASASEYKEIPSGTYWWVDTNVPSRKGGMAAADATGVAVGLWNHELTIIKSYRKGDQTVR